MIQQPHNTQTGQKDHFTQEKEGQCRERNEGAERISACHCLSTTLNNDASPQDPDRAQLPDTDDAVSQNADDAEVKPDEAASEVHAAVPVSPSQQPEEEVTV